MSTIQATQKKPNKTVAERYLNELKYEELPIEIKKKVDEGWKAYVWAKFYKCGKTKTPEATPPAHPEWKFGPWIRTNHSDVFNKWYEAEFSVAK